MSGGAVDPPDLATPPHGQRESVRSCGHGNSRTRTADTRIFNAVLYQLS
jgi:hypothetical protein